MKNLEFGNLKISITYFNAVFISIILTACSSGNREQKDNGSADDNKELVLPENYSFDKQPAKTIMDFLKWYRDHMNIQTGLVNNSNGDTHDSTKFYTVNFEATENYLSVLKSTEFISDRYVEKWRGYFKKCDKDFRDNPTNDGPPDGFEYDFIMLSQEYDEDLENLEKSKIVSQSELANNATIRIHFPNGNKLIYILSKYEGHWRIDDIVRE